MDQTNTLTNEMFYRRFGDDLVPLTEDDIPCRPENRRKTDTSFLYVLIGCIVLVMPFVIYVLCHSDPSKLDGVNRSDELYHELHFDINKVAWRVTLASGISLGITIACAILFRYATSLMVWGILITSWMFFFVGSILLWIFVSNTIVPQLTFTVITVVLLLVLIFMKSKIRLATMLFKEATKASFDMQKVFFIPASTILILLVIAAGFGTATLYMSTAIDEQSENTNHLPDGFVAVIIINSIVTLWVVEFVIGVQYITVSGAVTKWFFTRDKTTLSDPVYISFFVALRYHLGTIALGSLIITLVAVLRAVLRSLAQNSKLKYCIDCCMSHIENFLRFFTKNAYIVTAMHGTPFVESGKQAVKLLTLNICNTVAITSIGDFVLGMCNVLVVGLSVAVTYLLLGNEYKEYYFCYIFVACVALICCFTILGTFEIAFSTLFLCICQDFLLNNGAEKPYAMTRNLMEFLDSSKKAFADKIEKKGLPTI